MELQVNGNKTYVATGGKDFDNSLPTVLFLHGSGMDHRAWALQTRWFAFHGYSVLAPDFPGHSLSEGEPLKSIEAMGAWLTDFLTAADAKQVHVVGHSQGFLTALELANNSPEKVLSLTGIGTAAAIPVNPALIETAEVAPAKAADMMLQWGFGPGAQYGISAVPGMQPIAIGRQIMASNPLAVDLKACANYEAGAGIAENLDVASCLILAGKDRMTPLKAGKALGVALKAQITVLPQFGHMLPVEAPKESLRALREFISSL